jgi:hypothetical protein
VGGNQLVFVCCCFQKTKTTTKKPLFCLFLKFWIAVCAVCSSVGEGSRQSSVISQILFEIQDKAIMGQAHSEPIPPRKAVSYLPAVESFLTDGPSKRNKKVLVIGSGCAGLGAAWHLNRAGVDVTVYEALEKLGGHANTVNGKI